VEPADGAARVTTVASAEAGAPPADEVRVDPGRPWFPALDGMRGLAAALVVVFHVTGAVTRFPAWTWGEGLARFGNLGVALFFVLSGFLLTRPFFANHLAQERPPQLGRYAVRRLARIVPAYWVALTVWLFVIRDRPPLGGSTAYIWLYGFAQVYDRRYVDRGGALSVAWTLSIEMSFYLLLPALAWVLCRLAARGPVAHRVRVLALACTALFVGGSAFRRWMWEQGGDWAFRSYSLLGHIGWFGLGMAVAALVAGVAAGVPPPRWIRDLASIPALSLGLAAGVAWLTTLLPLPLPGYPQKPSEQLVIFVGNGLAGALCLLPLVFGDQTDGPVRAVLSSGPARWLGQISFGLYLWHTPILSVVNEWVADDRVPGSAPARLAVVAVLSLAAAQLSWVVVERPALALANRVTSR
jgi:peptidoglycan/LPS O-acetylase OafA/YrhL